MAFIELHGVLGKDPDVITTDKSVFTSLKIAENKGYFDKNKNQWVSQATNWFDVNCFDKNGEKASLLKKGDKVLIKGSLDVYKKDRLSDPKFVMSITAKVLRKIESIKLSDGDLTFFSQGEPDFDQPLDNYENSK